jgi:hypothetical protein
MPYSLEDEEWDWVDEGELHALQHTIYRIQAEFPGIALEAPTVAEIEYLADHSLLSTSEVLYSLEGDANAQYLAAFEEGDALWDTEQEALEIDSMLINLEQDLEELEKEITKDNQQLLHKLEQLAQRLNTVEECLNIADWGSASGRLSELVNIASAFKEKIELLGTALIAQWEADVDS